MFVSWQCRLYYASRFASWRHGSVYVLGKKNKFLANFLVAFAPLHKNEITTAFKHFLPVK